jgi:Fe-S cluster assembly protein SufD
MKSQTPHYGFTREAVEAISYFKEEPSWMREIRLDAWNTFERFPKPELVPELDSIQSFREPPERAVPSHLWPGDLKHALEEKGDEEGLIIQRDSTVLSRALTKEQAKRGVIFTDLDTALKTAPELVAQYFARPTAPQDALSALHTAFWSGGTFLYVPDYVEVLLPFHTCYWMSAPGSAVFPHTLIVAEKGSRISFIDEFLSVHWESPALSIGAAQVMVGDHAQVHMTQIQNWGRHVFHRSVQQSHVAGSGKLHTAEWSGSRPVVSLERAAELYPEVRT